MTEVRSFLVVSEKHSKDSYSNLGIRKAKVEGLMRKECPNIEINLTNCNCTYPCDTKGRCCECLNNHRSHGELPACYFSADIERTYDRSIRRFISAYKQH